MAGWPSVCVVDANILIDLHAGGMLKEAIKLPFSWITADVVLAELHEPDGAELLQYGLQSVKLSGEQVLAVANLVARHRSVSTNDLFALVLARESGATLLTGDQHLRKIALEHNLPVHGTLWVLDELVARNFIAASDAASALKDMLAAGSRLPSDECETRMERWK